MAKQFDSQTTTGDQLVGLTSALIRAEHQHAAYFAQRLGLPSADALALYHLANEPLRSSELANRLGLTPGSVTSLVDRLIARGLARRVAHATDRRVVLVEMTDAGHGASWETLQHFIRGVVEMSASRTSVESAVIAEFLSDLIDLVHTDTERMQGQRPGVR